VRYRLQKSEIIAPWVNARATQVVCIYVAAPRPEITHTVLLSAEDVATAPSSDKRGSVLHFTCCVLLLAFLLSGLAAHALAHLY